MIFHLIQTVKMTSWHDLADDLNKNPILFWLKYGSDDDDDDWVDEDDNDGVMMMILMVSHG